MFVNVRTALEFSAPVYVAWNLGYTISCFHQELLRESKLPPSMDAREKMKELSRIKKLAQELRGLGISSEPSFRPKITREVPDFDAQHRMMAKKLANTKAIKVKCVPIGAVGVCSNLRCGNMTLHTNLHTVTIELFSCALLWTIFEPISAFFIWSG